MDLFGQLLLTQLVQGEELPGQCDVLQEAAAGQLDPDDNLSVGDHHGHVPELDLQVLRELLTPLVGGIHGEEDPELRIHVDRVPVSEDKLFPLLFLA